MKQSIGYTLSLNIAITFIIIVFAFIAMALSYYRAFKVSKVITAAIEKNEGYTFDTEKEIINKLSSIGYNMTKVNCPKERNSCKLTGYGYKYSQGQAGYCVYLCEEDGGYYRYKTTTNMMLNIPIINRITNIPVEINTNKMYGYDIDRSKHEQEEPETPKLCELQEGNSQEIGSKYVCHLDTDRTFYVLENNDISSYLSLIMNENLGTSVWCSVSESGCRINGKLDNSSGPIIANAYLVSQTSNWRVEDSLPSKEQIENASSVPNLDWLYTSSNSSRPGFWTSSVDENNSVNAKYVYHNTGKITNMNISDHQDIRPVITIRKTQLN